MIARQHIFMAAGGEVMYSRLQANECGKYDFVLVNDSRTFLPEVETTDIKALLDAGVDVKRVNTKIIPSSQVVTDLTFEEAQETTEEKGE